MKAALKVAALAFAGALVVVAGVKASDPVGVYAIVERVVFEPSESAPKTVQIWGAFAPSVEPPRPSYKPEQAYGGVQKGYMYFTCPAGKESNCVAEWNDLKSVAGKSEVVGFGTRWQQVKPHVRAAGEKPASPDIYDMNVGVVKMGRYAEYPSIVTALKAALGR